MPDASPLTPKRPCPICGKPPSEKNDPFCSKRCADVDLNRWLKGVYVVPGPALDDDEADQPREKPPTRES